MSNITVGLMFQKYLPKEGLPLNSNVSEKNIFCFEMLSVDYELAQLQQLTVVSPVTELLAPPIGSFWHFQYIFYGIRYFAYIYFCNIFYAQKTNGEYNICKRNPF